ncbi:VOC family protein [Actinomadura flavalba]|uniref:VOC family protein n=1 Tax=Actinomadura flavalba TaxID=1120938 RepID=UPI00036C3A3C|nr:VOC family protein [Actinomadura flavalba]
MTLNSAGLMAFLPSSDLDRARAFYEGVLGLTVSGTNPAAVVFGRLRVTLAGAFTPQPFTVFGWEVTDLHADLARLRNQGVTFLRYDGLEQDDDGVWTAPNGDRIAWFHDPDHNVLSLAQLA